MWPSPLELFQGGHLFPCCLAYLGPNWLTKIQTSSTIKLVRRHTYSWPHKWDIFLHIYFWGFPIADHRLDSIGSITSFYIWAFRWYFKIFIIISNPTILVTLIIFQLRYLDLYVTHGCTNGLMTPYLAI